MNAAPDTDDEQLELQPLVAPEATRNKLRTLRFVLFWVGVGCALCTLGVLLVLLLGSLGVDQHRVVVTVSSGVNVGVLLMGPAGFARGQLRFPVLMEMLPCERALRRHWSRCPFSHCADRQGDLFYTTRYPLWSYMARSGYIFAAVDVPGTGSSNGPTVPKEYSEQELQAGAEVIAYLATQPYATGKVGLVGAAVLIDACWPGPLLDDGRCCGRQVMERVQRHHVCHAPDAVRGGAVHCARLGRCACRAGVQLRFDHPLDLFFNDVHYTMGAKHFGTPRCLLQRRPHSERRRLHHGADQ